MKRRLFLIIIACMICLSVPGLLSACTKDSLLGIYNRSLQAAGENVLTSHPTGDRAFGSDAYAGTYTAALEDATIREYLFGGTSIDREDGYHFALEADFDARQGSASLILEEGSEDPQVLFSGSGHFETELDLGPGSDYFVLETTDYTGDISLSIQ